MQATGGMSSPGKNAIIAYKVNEGNKDLDLALYIGNTEKMKKDISQPITSSPKSSIELAVDDGINTCFAGTRNQETHHPGSWFHHHIQL